MQFASSALSSLEGDPGDPGFLFTHRWIVEFKPVKDTVPQVPTSTRDKVCSLFGAILARSKGGLIMPAQDGSMAPVLASSADIPANDLFNAYFAPLQHNTSLKGIICFKSEVNFATLRKELWKFLRSANCWITQTKIPTSSEIKALGWFKQSVPRFFDPAKTREELNKLIDPNTTFDFNSAMIDMVPANIYANGKSTRAVKVFVSAESYSQALDIFVQAFKKLNAGGPETKKECPNIYDYKFVPFQLNVGDIKVDSKAIMASLIEENNNYLCSRTHVFIQNADLSITVDGSNTFGQSLLDMSSDILKVHQRTNRFGAVVYLEVPFDKEAEVFDLVSAKVDLLKSTLNHFAADNNDPVVVMSASNFNAPARKKHKTNSALQDFIRSTIPLEPRMPMWLLVKRPSRIK
jgi:hypothetical protein